MATINLLTDAPNYNLALMKLSAWHKAQGDTVFLNEPLQPAEKTYASILFDWNKDKFFADVYGGPQFPTVNLPPEVERMRPDYELYNIDHSLGYTFRPCYRHCDFCLVKTFKFPDKKHHSIWEFHEERFDKICLMNNNTFIDPLWKSTFQEIWDADLKVMEHGMDIRLLDNEKIEAIKNTKFSGKLHFAWDRMRDKKNILTGLRLLKEYKIHSRMYVLCGYDSTMEEDLERCQTIVDYNQVPYVMPFNLTKTVRLFKGFMNAPANWWHGKENITLEWEKFQRGKKYVKMDEGQTDLFE